MSTPTIEAAWRDRATLAQPTLSNGLTEAETSATASVMGLTHDSEYVARFGRVTLSGPREDVEFAVRHLPDVDDGAQQPATPEPAKVVPYNPTEEMRWAMKRIDPALSSEQCRALWSAAWSATPSTHPAQATQTAEVTGEPVYQICKKDSQSISSAWIDVEKQVYEDAGIYPEYGRRTLYTHPAPSAPPDVVRDAERYRWLRDPKNHAQIGVGQWTDDGFGWRYSDEADEAIDAAMLAAKDASA